MTENVPAYHHVQRGLFHLVFYGLGIAMVVLAIVYRDEVAAHLWIAILPVGMLCRAAAFHYLDVSDAGTHLALRYGPMPVPWFRKKIAYAAISSVEPSVASVFAGFGVHWLPVSGWMYNIWGFQCVRMIVNGKPVRVGTDDVEGLVAFLRARLASRAA